MADIAAEGDQGGIGVFGGKILELKRRMGHEGGEDRHGLAEVVEKAKSNRGKSLEAVGVGLAEEFGEVGGRGDHGREEELGLSRESLKEHAFGHSGAAGDLLRGGREAFFQEDFAGDGEQGFVGEAFGAGHGLPL